MEGLRARLDALPSMDRRTKAKVIAQDTNATKIEALLTDTQKQQFEQLQAERYQR